jgi:hypothetical protein
MRNGIEYYFVEVTCMTKHSMNSKLMEKKPTNCIRKHIDVIICGSPPRKPKRSVIVEETIDGENYIFDSNVCALIFKRLRSVMGEGAVALIV